LALNGITVLIVEDEHLFRQLLIAQLSGHPKVTVVGDASSGEEAIEKAESLKPDVVLMDIELGSGPNGIEAATTIRTTRPATGIVLLSMHKDRQYLAATIADEAAGWSYLLKKNVRDAEMLVRAIKGSSWGMVVVDAELTEELRPRANTPLGAMTDEQLRLLELLAQGYSDVSIAATLRFTDGEAVQERLKAIYQTLGIKTDGAVEPRVKAVVAYLEQSRNR
jgi:DNA-binding NarL/FixJ family response regulator